MDPQAFEAQLEADGFTEIETKSLPEKPENYMHVHDCSVRSLVLEGAFIVRLAGQQVTFGPGDVFDVVEGTEHTEETGENGARVLIGRKYD